MAAPGFSPATASADADMSYRVALGHHHLGLEAYHPPPMDAPGAYQQHHPGHGAPPRPRHHQREQQVQGGGGQFGILAPTTIPQDVFVDASHGSLDATQKEPPGLEGAGAGPGPSSSSHPSGRIVVDPPDLAAWRQRLFSVDEMIVLTNDQFETYFPHIDNVYSHRSTQRYKRTPFVSHYWDCRMKGRPSGTPKSDDPNKKKRKRNARERDLCDVKIKITEYNPGSRIPLEGGAWLPLPNSNAHHQQDQQHPPAPPLEVGPGQKFWTIQRVNGNGGNGKGDGVAGPHRHTLEKSDEIKKNSVQRHLSKQEKEAKKVQKPTQRKATGEALATVKKRRKDSDLKLYAACFCPFSQRVWIALEAKGMAYQYCEMDPSRTPVPPQLLEADPRGRTPVLCHGEWACSESAVILEYLEDLGGLSLFPSDPRLKADCRLWIHHINTRIVPSFDDIMRARDAGLQADAVNRLQGAIMSLVLAADEEGPYFTGRQLGIVDVHFAPFALRLSRILEPLHGWAPPVPGTRWHRWLEALEEDAHVRATTSGRKLYVEMANLLVQQAPVP